MEKFRMKINYTLIVFVYYLKSEESRNFLRGIFADKEEACIERAKQGLDNTDQGADGYQQRQHYLSQIHGGCSEQHARDICTRDCPNP
jgi:hypothetical protein